MLRLPVAGGLPQCEQSNHTTDPQHAEFDAAQFLVRLPVLVFFLVEFREFLFQFEELLIRLPELLIEFPVLRITLIFIGLAPFILRQSALFQRKLVYRR